MQQTIAVIAVNAAGRETASRIAALLPGARLHGRTGRIDDCDVPFAETTAHVRQLFGDGVPVVAVCAAGILIRAVAPLLLDKRAEPPVIAVSPDGASVVPLLGGHHGANRLARHIAAGLKGHAAITTAGDVALGLALDDPPRGWHVANPALAKPVASALLAGEPVRLAVDAARGQSAWISAPGLGTEGAFGIHVTDRAVESTRDLILHPPVLALGVGCSRGATADELKALVADSLADAGYAQGSVALVASLDLKADEDAVHALAAGLGVPARFFTPAELEAETPRLANPSEVVFAETGCHGVAEAAALAAAGPGAELVLTKRKSAMATCAVARSAAALHPQRIGRPRGRLFVVGIGPGGPASRTFEAASAIARSSDLVGYKLYLDLIADISAGKTCHAGAMKAEETRVRQALDLAAEGRSVSLVCSGDAGIYAMATLVFELIDREDLPGWNRIEVSVIPGISALQGAAARAGAIINHDFCAISLSDLLTPWPHIERRIQAAAEGDFVVAFYNPVSKRRREQLPSARRILLGHRPASTPVVLARNVGRDGERITVTTLDALDPADVDMLTVVLVGNSETRTVTRAGKVWAYTPRGYASKWE
ncbi:MAG: precorrin-3B C(17)-methyltransferase [Telmatospirillum sp.]|nr:precorrin-3B C(17)-methyltransferase [Telmatospirillum sp.]